MSNDTITDMNHLEIQHALDRVLLTVSKPGRYAGGEYNQVVKDWAQFKRASHWRSPTSTISECRILA